MLPDELKLLADATYNPLSDMVEDGKHVFLIMRGLPGSGKSSVSKYIQEKFQNELGVQVVRICTDEILEMCEGAYLWAGNKMSLYHSIAAVIASQAIHSGVPVIILDNTNTQKKEYKRYIAIAESSCVIWECIVGGVSDEDVENSFERNSHNVPMEAIKRMAARFQN